MTPLRDAEKFDPFEAWDRLDPARQRIVGAAAIAEAYAGVALVAMAMGERALGFEAAFEATGELIAGSLPADLAIERGRAMPLPDLAGFGIRACRVCGCTDSCGCPEGCEWVEPDLCSACATPAEAG